MGKPCFKAEVQAPRECRAGAGGWRKVGGGGHRRVRRCEMTDQHRQALLGSSASYVEAKIAFTHAILAAQRRGRGGCPRSLGRGVNGDYAGVEGKSTRSIHCRSEWRPKEHLPLFRCASR